MEGHFRYEGTVGAVPNKDCHCCAAAAAKFCVVRPIDPRHDERTCGVCAAAQKGRCDLHGRGLATALAEHKMPDKGSQDAWNDATATIVKRTANLKPEVRVSIHVAASEASPEQVEMGAFPVELLIHYKQLDPG